MAKRRAPKGGYSFDSKVDYREQVWRTIQHGFACDTANKHALLMPSAEGTEIDVALRHGFKEEHLHIVDDNPAIVATLRRRYRKINTYGKTASIACERIVRKGIRLDAANFDFTSCVGLPLFQETSLIGAADCFASKAFVAVTVLRGRESCLFRPSLESPVVEDTMLDIERRTHGNREVLTTDASRLAVVFAALTAAQSRNNKLISVHPRRVGIYLSPAAKQTMLWCVSRLLDMRYLMERVELRKVSPAELLLLTQMKRGLTDGSRTGALAELCRSFEEAWPEVA